MSATDDRGTGTAVLGTGIMGAAMARNLLRAGLRTTVWDRSASATAPLAEAGAEVAATPPTRCAMPGSSSPCCRPRTSSPR